MILSGFGVVIFLGKAWPQSEGRRHADLKVKLPPDQLQIDFVEEYSFLKGLHFVVQADPHVRLRV